MATSDARSAGKDAPDLTDLSRGSRLDALKRTVKAFKQDKLTIWAAALTYFGILSIFPALLVVVSVLGLIGPSVTDSLINNLKEVAPGPAQEIVTDAIKNLQGSRGSSGIALIIGLAAAIWSASGYVSGFMEASNAIYDVEEGRSLTKTLPTRVGLTLVLMVLAGFIAFAVTLTGGIARHVGDLLGVGDSAVQAWGLAKWPVLLLFVSIMFALLYWGAPNVKLRFRILSPGAILAVIGWVIASLLFAFYVGNFSAYNKTYGALAGPIVFLLWLWISNLCILLGAELNAELERSRKLESGAIAHADEQFVEMRDTEKIEGE
jgi:membrane protein